MFPFIALDRDLDLTQYPLVRLTDCRAQGGNGCGGVEVEYIEEILRGEVFLRLESAAGQEGEGGADRSGVSERCADVEVIIVPQVRTVNDAKDVPLMLIPVFLHKHGGRPFKPVGQAIPGNAELTLQSLGHGGMVFIPVLPKKGAAGTLPAAGIGHIENVFELRTVPAGVDEGDALAASPDVAVHGVIP